MFSIINFCMEQLYSSAFQEISDEDPQRDALESPRLLVGEREKDSASSLTMTNIGVLHYIKG